MGRNRKRFFALSIVAALAFAALPMAALAATPIPTGVTASLVDNNSAALVTWNHVSGCLNYTVRASLRDSNNVLVDFSEHTIPGDTNEFLFRPSVAGYYTFRVKAYVVSQGDSSYSTSTSSLYIDPGLAPTPEPTPSPTPIPTSSPFAPFYPELTPVPLPPDPTAVPVPLPYSVYYNYGIVKTVPGYYPRFNIPNITVTGDAPYVDNYIIRGNTTYVNSVDDITSNFVAQSMNFPVQYSNVPYDQSMHDSYWGYDAVFKMTLVFDSPLEIDYFVTLESNAMAYVFEPLISPELVSEIQWGIQTYGPDINTFTTSDTYTISSSSLNSGFTVKLPRDGSSTRYVIWFSFDSNKLEDALGEFHPFYYSSSFVKAYFHGVTFIPEPDDSTIIPVEIGNEIREHTTWVGRFFAGLWSNLSDAFGRVTTSIGTLGQNLFNWFVSLAQNIAAAASSIVNTIVQAVSDIFDFLVRLFVPSADDLESFLRDIKAAVTPAEGSTMAYPHALEMQIFEILARDYRAEPPPLELPEFSMNIQGRDYVVFPRTVIRLSTIFPERVRTWIHVFGDLTFGTWIAFFLRRKVKKLLDLRYSED